MLTFLISVLVIVAVVLCFRIIITAIQLVFQIILAIFGL